MIKYTGNTFEGVRVVLDSGSYTRCVFRRCELVYRGGELELIGNIFEDSQFTFEDAAGRTVDFLKRFAQTPGGAELIEATFGVDLNAPRKFTLQ